MTPKQLATVLFVLAVILSLISLAGYVLALRLSNALLFGFVAMMAFRRRP